MPKNAILSHPSAVIKNTSNANASGTYLRLVERTFQEFEQSHLRMLFEQTLANHDFKYNFKEYTKDVAELPYSEDGNRIYYPNVEQKNFEKIPGAPIGYWMHKDFLNIFINGNVLGNKYRTLAGSSTGDNKQFLRLWHEVDNNKVGYGLKKEYSGYSYKWIPCSKGGSFRRWYGNFEYLMNWDNNGEAIKYFVTHNPMILRQLHGVEDYLIPNYIFIKL